MSNETLRHPWQLVAQREISTKIRDKTFIGSTAFMLLVVLAAVIIPALLAGNDKADKIAVVDDAGAQVVQTRRRDRGRRGLRSHPYCERRVGRTARQGRRREGRSAAR